MEISMCINRAKNIVHDFSLFYKKKSFLSGSTKNHTIRMKNRHYAVIALLFVANAFLNYSGFAQANFELAERFTGEKTGKMVGSTQVFPRWIEDTDRFWYIYENGNGKNWYYVDA